MHISHIRSSSPLHPGLTPAEISLLRLLDMLTNGSALQISYTGTSLTYQPGIITGSAGRGLGASSDGLLVCRLPETCDRGVAWFLTFVCMLAPWARGECNVRFEGPGVITAATALGDISVDTVRAAVLPLYAQIGVQTARLELRVLQRSNAGPRGRGGGGIVELRFASQIKGLPRTLHLHRSPGRVKRIRGVAYCTGVSASGNARMIYEARGVLNALCGDVRVAAQYDAAPLVDDDAAAPGLSTKTKKKKKKTGVGFGMALVAEMSSPGVMYSADLASPSEGGVTPEEIGKRCGLQLLEAIADGGCVGRAGMASLLMSMAIGSEDVGRLRLGRNVVGSAEFLHLARDWRTFGGAGWGLRDASDGEDGEGEENEDDEDDDGRACNVIVSIKGAGIGNVGKGVV